MILSQPLPITYIHNSLNFTFEETQSAFVTIKRNGIIFFNEELDNENGIITVNMREILLNNFKLSGNIDNDGVVIVENESIIQIITQEFGTIEFTARTGVVNTGGYIIIQQPSIYSFVQDCKDLILQTEGLGSIKFQKNGVDFLEEQYYPFNGQITICMKDILKDMLSSEVINGTGYHIQPNQSAVINILFGNQNIEFIAISGGIGNDNIDTKDFFTKNFLTNTPQIEIANKNHKYYLSFFTALVSNTILESMHTLVLRIYFKVPLPLRYVDFTHTDISYNSIYTFVFDYNYLFRKIGYVDISAVDIYFISKKNIPETTKSYTHRFIFNKPDTRNDDIFMFENCMGSNETICFDGQMEMSENHKSTTYKILEKTSEFKTDFSIKYKKNSGFFRSKEQQKVASEFLSSKKRYHFVDGIFKEIFLLNIDANSIPLSVNDYTFEFAYSEDNRYRNISRIDNLQSY